MKREWLRKMCVLMTMVMILVSVNCQTTCAAINIEDDIMPLSIDASKSASLSISSGTAYAKCKVVGEVGNLDKIVINMYLQKKNSNGYFENYKSWYSTKSSYYHNLSKSCSVTSGTYRVYVRVICYNGSDAETTYLTTGTKTY